MNEGRGYGSPAAFRQALTAKLKAKAEEGPWTLSQLQRQMAAEVQLTALRAQAERREFALPGRFDVPDRTLWQPGYAAEAGRSLLSTARTLDEALEIVAPFLDPLLAGSATGRWDGGQGRWTG